MFQLASHLSSQAWAVAWVSGPVSLRSVWSQPTLFFALFFDAVREIKKSLFGWAPAWDAQKILRPGRGARIGSKARNFEEGSIPINLLFHARLYKPRFIASPILAGF